MLTGILAPMPEEIELILENMQVESIYESGKRVFYKGKLEGKDCVAALSRIGKVASSVTAAVMIEKFKINQLIVTGVAGAIAPHLKLGDIVVATESMQHDLDARPLWPQFEAPLLDKGFFPCDATMIDCAMCSCEDFLTKDFLNSIHSDDIKEFQLYSPKVYSGQICCGDQFISSEIQLNKIKSDLPEVMCVEMEAGAVGQVCYEYGVPYIVIRTISDSANEHAHIDFPKFIKNVAKNYSLGITKRLLRTTF